MVLCALVSCEGPVDLISPDQDPPGQQKPEDRPDSVRTELSVNVDDLVLPAEDALEVVRVNANKPWVATYDGGGWLTIDKTESSASVTRIVVTAEDNEELIERKAEITITAEDVVRKVVVTQAAYDLSRYQNIPHIYIDVNGQKIADKKNYIKGTVIVKDPEKLYSNVEEQILVMTEDGIRGRGNSTWAWPKKPYKLKFDEKVSILGFPADKEWCLLANYADLSLLRNLTAMRLSEICGFSWTPRMCSVEVTLDGKYQGVYNFCEHKKVSKYRVNIEVCEGNECEAVTGGYYFEIDERSVGEDELCWETSMKVPMLFCDPEEPTEQQWDYVKTYFNDFEAALNRGDYSEETGYPKYIDVKSFVDYYIVQELTKNIDGNLRLSSFLTKEIGKKLEMYHMWDFDLTMGVSGYFDGTVGNGPKNFYIKNYGWYPYLFKDRNFVKRVQDRWNELYPQLTAIPAFIDRQARCLEKAAERNFQVWPVGSLDASAGWIKYTPQGSWQAELEYLKGFYTARLAWLDSALKAL